MTVYAMHEKPPLPKRRRSVSYKNTDDAPTDNRFSTVNPTSGIPTARRSVIYSGNANGTTISTPTRSVWMKWPVRRKLSAMLK